MYEFNALSPAPVDTIRKLAQLFETAVGLGLEHSATQHPANQSKVQGGHGTSIYEAARNNKHTKVMTTTIDWYGDGEIVVVKSTYGLDIDFPVLDFRTIEGLGIFISGTPVLKMHRIRPFAIDCKEKDIFKAARIKIALLRKHLKNYACTALSLSRVRVSFAVTLAKENFGTGVKDQARAGLNSRIKSFQSKLKKIRKEIASI